MFVQLVFLITIANSQLLKHVSDCFSNCMNCEVFQPSECLQIQGLPTCQNGYSFNQQSKQCDLKSVFQSNFSSFQFNQQSIIRNLNKKQTDWKQGKVSQCSYVNQKGVQKYINVIGLFRQVYSISKQFSISENHQFFYFSFNLLRSSWMPNNDFLIIDFQSGTKLIGSYEISYGNKLQKTQENVILCNQQSVISQKYNIKINHHSFKTNKIKITITGFLFTSVWGVSNLKLIPGCQKFTVFNRLTQNCDFCNVGYFPVYKNYQLQRCRKCPFQCTKCVNQTYCTACTRGYRIWSNNSCIVNDDFKRLQIKQFMNSQYKTCRQMNISYHSNSENQSIQTLSYDNPSNTPFGDIKIVFQFVYNSKFQFNNGTVDIQLNDKKISHINQVNLTNQGFQACSLQSLDRYSVFKLTVPVYNVSSQMKISFRINECRQCKFGVSNLNIVYVQNSNQDIISSLGLTTFNSYNNAKLNLLNQQVQNQQSQTASSYSTNTLNSSTGKVSTLINSSSPSKILQSSHLDGTANTFAIKNNSSINDSSTSYINDIFNHVYNNNNDSNLNKSNITINAINNSYSAMNSTFTNHDNKENTPSVITQKITTNQSLTAKNSTKNSAQTSNSANTTTNSTITTTTNHSTIAINQKIDTNKLTEQKNDSKIDHISFSKDGNNGMIIKLNLKYFTNLKSNQTLIMDLTSTSQTDNHYNDIKLNSNLPQHAETNQTRQNIYISQSNSYSNLKSFTFYTDKTYIDQRVTLYALSNSTKTQLTSFEIKRTDYLEIDSQHVLSAFQTMFMAFSWIFLLIGILALLSGKYFLVQESIQSLQFLFLGIYVFTSYLPASILNTLSGLRRLQNLDLFAQTHLNKIQRFFLGDLIQDGPLRFTLFHEDINFIRGSIPLIFLALIVVLWYLIVFLVDKQNYPKSNNGEQNQIEQVYVSQATSQFNQLGFIKSFYLFVCKQIIDKKLNYAFQSIKFFFLPLIFLSFKQFNNFKYPQGQSGEIINMILCLIIFLAFFAGAILLTIFCSRKYFQQQYESFISNLQAIYYKKIPKTYLPTQHHRVAHPLFRYFKVFFFSLLVAFLGNYSVLISVIMVLLYGGEIFYAWFQQIYQDSLHFKFLILESILMSTLYILLLVISQVSGVVSTSGYISIGYVYMSIAIVVVLNSFARMGYLITNYIYKIKDNGKRGNRAALREQIIV